MIAPCPSSVRPPFVRVALLLMLALPALALASDPATRTKPADTPAPPEPGDLEEVWEFSLAGAQEDPPNTSMATGQGFVIRDGSRVEIEMSWEGLSGPVTGAHLHGPVAYGTEAPVLFDLVPGAKPGGTASPLEASFELAPGALEMLRDGLVYADIHTAVYPGGEVRGPVLPAIDEFDDEFEGSEDGDAEGFDSEGYDDDLDYEDDPDEEDEGDFDEGDEAPPDAERTGS